MKNRETQRIHGLGLLVLGALASLWLAGTEGYASWHFDFEGGIPGGLILRDAERTADSSEVVSGSFSLKASRVGSTEEWHEFVHTATDVLFEPSRAYRVSFDYKVLDRGPEGTRHARPQFYTLLRSRSMGPHDPTDRYGPFWLLGTGMKGHVDTLYETGEVEDYYLIIGIRREAALALDNLEIATTTQAVLGDGDPIRVFPRAEDPVRDELDRLREAQRSESIMGGILNVICNEMGPLSDEERRAVVNELRLDFVDWVPLSHRRRHSTGLEFGIRTAASEIEYQEHYRVEEPRLYPRRFEELWNAGFAVSLWGTPIQDETWAEGGWYTCHNGERWRERYLESLKWTAGFYEGLCQDNIACAPFNKGGGCFCQDCERLFGDSLAERYTKEELSAWGVEELGDFSIRDRIVRTGRLGVAALDDPLTREYIKFQYASHRDRWAEHVLEVKTLAAESGVPFFPVLGNQIGLQGFFPFAVLLSPYNDAIEIEHIGTTREVIGEEGILYRLGRASGYEARPVWARGVFLDEETRRPTESVAFWRWLLGEALACGARHTYHLLRKDQRQFTMIGGATEAYSVDYRANEGLYRVFTDFARFCDENRALLAPRQSLARTAVVYSLPSMMWRQFPPLELHAWAGYATLRQTCGELNGKHIPFDMVIFGHPELWDDRPVFENFSKYDNLVLPLADCLSEPQVKALKAFAEEGGLIVRRGEIGLYDENRNRRIHGRLISRNVLRWEEAEAWRVLGERSGLGLEAPATLLAHPWYSPDPGVYSVHFVNRAFEPPADTTTPASIQSLSLELAEVQLPLHFSWLVPGGESPDVATPITPDRTIVREGRWHVTFRTLPEVESYAVLVIGDPAVLTDANRQAKEHRRKDMNQVMEYSLKRLE